MDITLRTRIIQEAKHIVLTGNTLRQTAKFFGVSKSTVHLDMSKRLKKINIDLYLKVSKKLDFNFSQKHIRGGNSTAKKYKKNIIEK